jgi:hypothetical protein
MPDLKYHLQFTIPWVKLWFAFVAIAMVGIAAGVMTGRIEKAPKGSEDECVRYSTRTDEWCD